MSTSSSSSLLGSTACEKGERNGIGSWYGIPVMEDFWKELPRPFFALAPMEDVTDAAFRALIARYSSREVPRVFFTEFTSADGLLSAPDDGKQKLLKKFEFSEAERPVVAQLFTSSPEHMEGAAKLCAVLGFDGFDINMGCPDRAIEKQQCGAALIKEPKLARELVRAAKRGFGGPVSVKTRLGYNADELETWLPELLAEEPAAITLHARTRKEMSAVPARWERVARAVQIRDSLRSKTLIIGNGDVAGLADAREKCASTGADGAMLGRAVFGNPWIFAANESEPTRSERIRALIDHIGLFQEKMRGYSNGAVMKKHFKAYICGWGGAKELRVRLMETGSLDTTIEMLRNESHA